MKQPNLSKENHPIESKLGSWNVWKLKYAKILFPFKIYTMYVHVHIVIHIKLI